MGLRLKKIYSGKTKDLFEVILKKGAATYEDSDGGLCVLRFKDNILGRNGIPDSGGNEVVGVSKGKGIASCALTSYFMDVFEKGGVPTHFVKKLGGRMILIHRVNRIPIEFICRNYAFGSYLRRHPRVKSLKKIRRPVIEYTLKSDRADDPLLSCEEILRYVSRRELKEIKKIITHANRLLLRICNRHGVIIADFKVEFGRSDRQGKLLLIDDFSTDTARFFSKKDKHLMSYREVRRIFKA